jgi:phospholipase/carboxylesterase
MPEITTSRGDDRPIEGFTTTYLSSDSARPVRLFLPADHQPKYAYPLLMVFHAEGEDENAVVRLIPGLSRRNYIAASPRGPVRLGASATGRQEFGWGKTERWADEYLLATVAHIKREYHIHSERIYFVGVGTGATVAYRLGLAMGSDVAGVVALNGQLPKLNSRARSRLNVTSGLRFFIGHGVNNPVVPLSTARQATRALDAAGVDVRLASYPTTHRIHPDMLRDVNRWIMGAVNTDFDSAPTPTVG